MSIGITELIRLGGLDMQWRLDGSGAIKVLVVVQVIVKGSQLFYTNILML